ncbi:MAG: outer membrane lipoprotein-sorting protein [Calditrichaeota bacterium]|nr:MAG: outer membrane lipoprotein-sorting protein [Calditrichota bacterium]
MRRMLVFLLVGVAAGWSQNAREILQRAENAIKGKSSHAILEMIVQRPEFTRRLKMESWWVGNQKALIVILEPAREAGNKTLKVGNEMWNYLRNTETVIKIPPSMMLQSWNGSDFTNDDLVRESNLVRDYQVTLAGTDTVEGQPCWLLELRPRPEAPVVWDRLLYAVRKADYLPARVDYYDERGRLVRSLLFSEVKKMGGRTIPTRWVMINRQKENHRTEIRLLQAEFDIPIPERMFSLRELERGR